MKMQRHIPLWIFLLCALLWAISTVVFGWIVHSTLTGIDGFRWNRTVGELAVEVAAFPATANSVLSEITQHATGNYKDQAIRIARDTDIDYSEFIPVPMSDGIDVDGLFMWSKPAKMAYGWRVLVGAFSIDGEIENSALLISPDLEIVKKWILNETAVGDVIPKPKHRKFVHGLEILDDGSLIFTFDGSISLQRFDSCGDQQWSAGGEYHHAVTLDETKKSVWTFSGYETIAQVSVNDGKVLTEFSMDEVIANNPTLDLLEIRRKHSNDLGINSRDTEGVWLYDKFHFNDVDPLPSGLADVYPQFNRGDLLVSARSLNLIFVLDPTTLEIKWWRVGFVQRQHDPDWTGNGEIIVLNNRMSRDYSEIISINPQTFEKKTILDGRATNFYTRIRGKQQLLKNGNLIITSSQQGRAFEVNKDGEIAFDIVNQKPDSDDTNYAVSELKWFPPQQFDTGTWKCPPKI